MKSVATVDRLVRRYCIFFCQIRNLSIATYFSRLYQNVRDCNHIIYIIIINCIIAHISIVLIEHYIKLLGIVIKTETFVRKLPQYPPLPS